MRALETILAYGDLRGRALVLRAWRFGENRLDGLKEADVVTDADGVFVGDG